MEINGISGVGAPASAIGMNGSSRGQADPVCRDLQRQIEDLQNQMKELSSNREMSAEMKAKKRQELQKQISDLEVQLRQRQIEVKREETMKKRQENYSMDEMLGTRQRAKKSDKQSTGLSAGSMEALISADASMKQADVNGSVARKMEGRAHVLEAEIKLDSGLGAVSERKEEALAEAKSLASEATTAQMSDLARANKAAQKANEADQSNGTARTEANQKKDAGKTDKDDAGKEKTVSGAEQGENGSTFDAEQLGIPFSRGYQPVDVKL